MPRLCQFANIAGRPREGIHSVRIPYVDWALADTLLTVLLALALGRGQVCASLLWFGALLVLALCVHRLFCVRARLA